MKTLNKILAAGMIGLVGLVGCKEKPSDLNKFALKEYQEARQKFSDKEWKITWSADGKRKAVLYNDGNYNYAFVLNADETECKNCSNYVTQDIAGPYLSPDGERITFAQKIQGNWEIYTMNADGTNQ